MKDAGVGVLYFGKQKNVVVDLGIGGGGQHGQSSGYLDHSMHERVFHHHNLFGIAGGQLFPRVQHWLVLGHGQRRYHLRFEGINEDDGHEAPRPGENAQDVFR